MKRFRLIILTGLIGTVFLALIISACNLQPSEKRARMTFFIGIDVSGSFKGYHDDSISFLAHYIYGHLKELGGLTKPRELFVGPIGGKYKNEPKAFHPIHDFDGKDIAQIEENLREWFPSSDTMSDFNSFFQQVARISKERNLILAPITVVMVSDGIPDVGEGSGPAQAKSPTTYQKIDLSPMEYLSKNLTLRLTYAGPKVSENWRQYVPHQRVRMWAVEADVMKGWSQQIQPGVDPANQDKLWKWVQDNVDFRVRSRGI